MRLTNFITIIIIALSIASCNGRSNRQTEITNEKQELNRHQDADSGPGKPSRIIEFTDSIQGSKIVNSISDDPKQPDNFLSVNELYKQFEKQGESFKIKSTDDTSVTGKEGTKISFTKHSFIDKITGEPVSGYLEVRLTEYYKLSDILLANLTTKSDNKILETGGMINLKVLSNGRECILKSDRTIKLEFPYKTKKDDMQVFEGNWNENSINWSLDKTSVTVIDTPVLTEIAVFTMVSKMPQYPGGQNQFQKFLSENITYPQQAKNDSIEGTVIVTFTVLANGNVDNPKVLRGIGGGCDKEVLRVINLMPRWIPGQQRGKSVAVSMTLPIRFNSDGYLGGTSRNKAPLLGRRNVSKNDLVENFEKQAKDGRIDRDNVAAYIFQTSKLGWINCDRFYMNNNPKVNYLIKLKDSEKSDVKMVFHKYKSILAGYHASNGHIFSSIPINSKVTVVAVKQQNEQAFLAVSETTIDKKGTLTLEFKPVTLALLKSEIQKLNAIN